CAFNRFSRSIAPPELPTAVYENTVPVANEFTVSLAGSYTYYLNAVMTLGGEAGAGDAVLGGGATQLEATFYPNPPN
ncbi:MAG TPA: hypothetical protein VF310_10545, partial [Vicinamibacteria bacterium]